jgi:heptosyltransferase-2
MTDHLPKNSNEARFLLIQTSFIGDVILATPLIEKLKRHFPGATVDLFIRKGNEGLFNCHPHIDTLYAWDKKGGGKYRQLLPMITKIRRKRYDYCINLQRHSTTGIITLFSGAKVTVGFTMNPFSRFFTRRFIHKIDADKGLTHEVDLYLQLLTGITPDVMRTLPRLYPSTDDFNHVSMPKPYITIAPASVWFTKQFPADQWVKLIDLVDPHVGVCLIGSPSDRPTCAYISEQSTHAGIVNRAGELTLLQSAALMYGAVMNYANDSSPVHLASAMNAPVTALFCSTVPSFGYGPLSTDSKIVQSERVLTCKPCGPHGHKQCPQGHFGCSDIPPEQILGLRGTTSSSRIFSASGS